MPGPNKQFDTTTALEAAMHVFWERGFQGASISELMLAMGISKKSLYDTFGNKESLFVKALEHYTTQNRDELRRQLSNDGSPLKNILAVMRKWQNQAGKAGSNGCMIGTNLADFKTDNHEVAKLLRTSLSDIEKVFFDTLNKARELGELDESTNPRDLARVLVALSQGTALIGRVLDTSTMPISIGNGLSNLLAIKK